MATSKKKYTIEFDKKEEDLFYRAKGKAAIERTSLKAVILNLLKEWVKGRKII